MVGKGAESRSQSSKGHGALLVHVQSYERPGIPALCPLSLFEREQGGGAESLWAPHAACLKPLNHPMGLCLP